MEQGFGKIMIYYYAFPHYRKAILEKLLEQSSNAVQLAAGIEGRAGIKVLRRKELPTLQELPSRSFGPLSWQIGVVRRAVGGEFDTVVVGPALSSLPTWCILLARRLQRKRTFLWGQCGRRGDRSIRRFAQELMNRLATGLMVYGQSEYQAAQELGLDEPKVHVVNNATRTNTPEEISDAEVFDRASSKFGRATSVGELTILYLGRVIPEKKVDVLLEAGRLLVNNFPQLRIKVVGGGDGLQQVTAAFDEPYITFYGPVYDPAKLRSLFSEATIVCSPFHMGLVAVDALREGVPVMIPDNPMNASEVEALTPGVNAKYFKAGNSEDLAAAVSCFIADFRDISRTEYLHERRRQLEIWQPENVARQILDVISHANIPDHNAI